MKNSLNMRIRSASDHGQRPITLYKRLHLNIQQMKKWFWFLQILLTFPSGSFRWIFIFFLLIFLYMTYWSWLTTTMIQGESPSPFFDSTLTQTSCFRSTQRHLHFWCYFLTYWSISPPLGEGKHSFLGTCWPSRYFSFSCLSVSFCSYAVMCYLYWLRYLMGVVLGSFFASGNCFTVS